MVKIKMVLKDTLPKETFYDLDLTNNSMEYKGINNTITKYGSNIATYESMIIKNNVYVPH
jgi:hypothetical protein